MSLRNMQYQQQQQHPQLQHFQQQHPLLAAASGNNFAYGHPRGRYNGHVNGLRPLVGAGTSANGVYAGTAPSSYGTSSSGSGSGYDYHPQGPPPQAQPPHHPVHVPSGGSYAYHATANTGYGAPPPPPAHPPAAKKRKSGGGSSAVTALTLLSFFFFVNLLQGCLKDHMEALNPTVMVMTANVVRNRFNKLAEMNSREQSSSSPASINGGFSSGASIVMQPADLVAAAASPAPTTAIQLQSPYNSNAKLPPAATHYNYNNANANKQHNYEPSPEFYDSNSYPNQTLHSVISNGKRYNYHQEQHPAADAQQLHHFSNTHAESSSPWSYGSPMTSATSSSSSSSLTSSNRNHHSSSVYSSSWVTPRPSRISGSNYFDVDDDDDNGGGDYRRGESYYTRIN